ncbi:hypothetical protein [Piscinibacter terrae]|uniref:hypothetical protein n=1 Tax=Piscinibacter terrae TaxID=2496871 RepID=UPI000F595213|nr:hypothetical protein [Albitalea terrae]
MSKKQSPRSRGKGFKPNGPLADAARARGAGPGNIWYLFGNKAQSDLVVNSDAALLHVLSMEGSPEVKSYRIGIKSEKGPISATNLVERFDADVTRRGGQRELCLLERSVSAASDDSMVGQLKHEDHERLCAAIGAKYVRVTNEQLTKCAVLTENWKFGLAAISAARLHSLVNSDLSLSLLLRQRSSWTVGELLPCVEKDKVALFLAALFRAISNGTVASDLDSKLWGKATRIWKPGAVLETDSGADTSVAPSIGATVDDASALPEQVTARHLAAAQSRSDSLALMISRIANGAGGEPVWFTRKNLPPEYRDLSKWPTVDSSSLDGGDGPRPNEDRFNRCRAAILAYLEGGGVIAISAEHGVSRSEVLRLLNRAVQRHEDGRIFGWRALISHKHLAPYTRTAPVAPCAKNGRIGYSGVVGAFFDRFPDLQDLVDRLALRRPAKDEVAESQMNVSDIHAALLRACAKHPEITMFDWPLRPDNKGLGGLRSYVEALRADNPEQTAALMGGTGAANRLRLDSGVSSILNNLEPYKAVQQDGHRLDFIGSIRVPHPSGYVVIPIQRFILQPIVDVGSHAALGYELSMGREASANDALAAAKHALDTWSPLVMEKPPVPYPEGAGFPSGLIPELAGVGWSLHYIDNASINTSYAMVERMRKRVGCAVNFGRVKDWPRRKFVEAIFAVLEKRGFQRLPNTTGKDHKDVRRRSPEKQAVALQCDSSELVYLVDVALATWNATPLPSLGGRAPLQVLRELVQDPRSNFVPRPLPPLPPGMSDLDIVVETRSVRGKLDEGRSCYVEIDEVHYTNDVLARCFNLIGSGLSLHIDEADFRSVEAFLPDGSNLGVLKATEGWDRTPHSREIRKAINKLIRLKRIARHLGEDWVQAYLRYLATKAVESRDKQPKHKVSKEATAAAKVAHTTGLPIPEVPAAGTKPSRATRTPVPPRSVIPPPVRPPSPTTAPTTAPTTRPPWMRIRSTRRAVY